MDLQSICSLTAFVLLMCLYPEKQRKAQKELDEVLGGERLPTFEDQANLPYTTALVKEVLRYWERRLNHGRSSFRSVWRVYYYYISAYNIIIGAN